VFLNKTLPLAKLNCPHVFTVHVPVPSWVQPEWCVSL